MSVHSHFLALIFNINYMNDGKQVSFCKIHSFSRELGEGCWKRRWGDESL